MIKVTVTLECASSFSQRSFETDRLVLEKHHVTGLKYTNASAESECYKRRQIIKKLHSDYKRRS